MLKLLYVCAQVCVYTDLIPYNDSKIKMQSFPLSPSKYSFFCERAEVPQKFLILTEKQTCATMVIHPDTITGNLFRKFQVK